MTKYGQITQSSTKRQTAAALADAKARNSWSNGDAGDVLGCGEGTVRNRLEGDDPKNQMTVYELLRSIVGDGTAMANAILASVAHKVVPTARPITAEDAIRVAGAEARCAGEIIAAAPDGFDKDEASRLLPLVVAQQNELASLEATLRDVLMAERMI